MILVDSRQGSGLLAPIIKKIGVQCDAQFLEFGDACFEGNGPDGRMLIGIERKTLPDILACIEDARYAGHQRPGMAGMYQKSYLMIEGEFRPSFVQGQEGFLMHRGYDRSQSKHTWTLCESKGHPLMYYKLYRFLLSVRNSGVDVDYTRDLNHTAFNITEIFHYYQKRWADHRSMQQIHQISLPQLSGKPSLVRRWASDLTNIGVKLSAEAERYFRKPIRLAKSDEMDWMRLGLGVKTAQEIVREINGQG